MTRGKRIAISIGVLGAGIAVAVLLGGPPAKERSPAPKVIADVAPKTEPQRPPDVAPGKPQLLGRIGPPLPTASRPKRTFHSTPDSPRSAGTPQQLHRSSDLQANRSAKAFSRGQPLQGRPPETDGQTARRPATAAPMTESRAQTHVIRDGDTLSFLAQHYLGSVERHLEIYQANRDTLKHPDLLPIGAKLKIPPRNRPAPARVDLGEGNGRMVPIRPGALRRHRTGN